MSAAIHTEKNSVSKNTVRQNHTRDRKLWKPLDLTIIGFILLVTAVILYALFSQSAPAENLTAVIQYKGTATHTVLLSEVTETYELDVSGDIPVRLLIEPDGIRMLSSPCKDQICVHTGKIRASGETVVCLPAKVSVSITAQESKQSHIDGVVS